MNKQRGFTILEMLITIIAIAGTYGWIANIFKLAVSSFEPLTGVVILRVVGIFIAPLGAVLGFI